MPSCLLSFCLWQGAGSSCLPSHSETNASEIYFVELVKEDGTLGFSVTVRVLGLPWEVNSRKDVHLGPWWAFRSCGNC